MKPIIIAIAIYLIVGVLFAVALRGDEHHGPLWLILFWPKQLWDLIALLIMLSVGR